MKVMVDAARSWWSPLAEEQRRVAGNDVLEVKMELHRRWWSAWKQLNHSGKKKDAAGRVMMIKGETTSPKIKENEPEKEIERNRYTHGKGRVGDRGVRCS